MADQIPLQGVKVMVIDDSNTIRRSAEIFLLQAGCTVILAEDGFDALAKIADHQPDLVFVDIMMPRLDGYQTCALIKKNTKFQRTPGDHAVVEGRAVRPGPRPDGRVRPVPHQAVHQGEPAQGGGGAREQGSGVSGEARRRAMRAAEAVPRFGNDQQGGRSGSTAPGVSKKCARRDRRAMSRGRGSRAGTCPSKNTDRRRLADRAPCPERHAHQVGLRSRGERQRRGRDPQGQVAQARTSS